MRTPQQNCFQKIISIVSIAVVLLAGAPAPVVLGQNTGTLRGQVFDGAGNPLPGVKVTITSLDNGNSVATVTDISGTYLRPLLFPGSYRITASKDGFTDEGIETRVPLNATTEIKPPAITIRPATISSTTQPPATPTTSTPQGGASVKPSDSSILVNKSDPTRGANFDAVQLLSLPLPGIRTFDSLAFLVPGVTEPPEPIGKAAGPGIGAGVGTLGQFSVNGNRSRANNFTIDGSDNNDQDVGVRRQGFFALIPQSVETIQEFRISTLLWDSELGRNPGSQVNAVSKGGGNGFHGQLYSFMTNSSLDARNAFDFEGGPSGGKDDNTRLQSGFAIGGPIVRNRMQFFGGFEYLHLGATSEQHFATPNADQRGFPGKRIVFDSTGTLGFGILTTKGITPLGENLLQFYPLPNNPGGPYGSNTLTRVLAADGTGKLASFRLTSQINAKNAFSGRYNFTDDDRDLPSVNRAIDSAVTAHTRTQDLSLILDSSLSPIVANQSRFSFGRTRLNFSTGTLIFSGEIPADVSAFDRDFKPIPLAPFFQTSKTGPIGELNISPFSPVGLDVFLFPQSRANNTFQYADTFSRVSGDHSLKFGADVRHVQLNSVQNRNYRPLVEVNSGLDLGNGQLKVIPAIQLASLGLVSSVSQSLTLGPPDSTIGLRFNELNFFINDNWRVKNNLTLDYGLRYEYNSVPHEINNRIEKALQLENLPKAGNSPLDNPAFAKALDRGVNAYRVVLDGRKSIYEPDSYNFAPHFGFAWDPKSNGKMVVRGGAGMYFDTILGFLVSQSRNVFPNEIPLIADGSFFPPSGINLINPALFGFCTGVNCSNFIPITKGTPTAPNQLGGKPEDQAALIGALLKFTPNGGLSFTLPEKQLRMPRVYQWHLTVEQQTFGDLLLSASYVGTVGRNLPRATTPNLGSHLTPLVVVDQIGSFKFVDISGQIPLQRPIPALGAYQIFENRAPSVYHALQLEARKRYSRGVTFTAAYTWSHAIDEVSDVVDTAGASALPQTSVATQQNPVPARAERGNASFDVRHRFAASMIWDLPFYRGSKGSVATVLGGWKLASIFQARSGQPYTLILPFDDNLDGNLSDRPAGTKGLTFVDGHGSQRVVLASGTTFTDLNFNLSPDFNPGAARIGRNTFRGDSFINMDVALSKNFRFSENQNFEFRSEFFNALNRANFGLPIRVIGAPGFGSSVDTVNPARIIQFALKYSF